MSSQTLGLLSGHFLIATTIQSIALISRIRTITVQPIGTTTASKVEGVHLLSTWPCTNVLIEYKKINFDNLMNSLVSTETVVVIKSTLVLYVFAALDVLDVVALLGVVVVGSVWILEVGVTVTITVVKVVVTFIVTFIVKEEWSVKEDGTGNEVITFDVINDDEGERNGDDGKRDDMEGEGDFEKITGNDSEVVEGERYGGDWEGDGEGEGNVKLFSVSKRLK